MIEVTDLGFVEEVLKCELPVFACFTTGWCRTCYPTCLFADQLSEEYERYVKFVRLDTEKSPGTAEAYHIVAVPTILIFKDAKEIHRLIGFQDGSMLKPMLDILVRGPLERVDRNGINLKDRQ